MPKGLLTTAVETSGLQCALQNEHLLATWIPREQFIGQRAMFKMQPRFDADDDTDDEDNDDQDTDENDEDADEDLSSTDETSSSEDDEPNQATEGAVAQAVRA